MDEKYICIHAVIVSGAMQKSENNFIQQLGNLIMYADLDNLKKIKETFSDYWEKYLNGN